MPASIFELVGLAKFTKANVHELGGMKQRVAFARPRTESLACFMDEPLAALDAMTREQLYADIQRIWEKKRKTIILVTHNVREAVCLADRVILISPRPGRIVEECLIPCPARATLTAPSSLVTPRALPRRSRDTWLRKGPNETNSHCGRLFAALIGVWYAVIVSGRWSPVLLPPSGCRRVPVDRAPRRLDPRCHRCDPAPTAYRIRYWCRDRTAAWAAVQFIGVLRGHGWHPGARIANLGACWVPLALIWFGQTEGAMLFVVIMGTVWSVVIATDTGARTIPNLRPCSADDGFGRFPQVDARHPTGVTPVPRQRMKQGWAFAWRSLMAAEIYVTILTGFDWATCCTMAVSSIPWIR